MPELAKQYNAPKYATPTDPKPLRLQGGYDHEDNRDRQNKLGMMRVETVEKSLTDDDSSCTIAHTTETTIDTTLSYNPMADAPDPDIITPSYQPLHRKNKHWGDPCEPNQVCEGPEFMRIYSQNVNGISNHKGIMYE